VDLDSVLETTEEKAHLVTLNPPNIIKMPLETHPLRIKREVVGVVALEETRDKYSTDNYPGKPTTNNYASNVAIILDNNESWPTLTKGGNGNKKAKGGKKNPLRPYINTLMTGGNSPLPSSSTDTNNDGGLMKKDRRTN
jgi:hypothetical protein